MEPYWSYLIQSSCELRGPYCTACINSRHRYKVHQHQARKDLVLFLHTMDKPEKRDYWKLEFANGTLTPFSLSKDQIPANLARLCCVDSKCERIPQFDAGASLVKEKPVTKEKIVQTNTNTSCKNTQTVPNLVHRDVQTFPTTTTTKEESSATVRTANVPENIAEVKKPVLSGSDIGSSTVFYPSQKSTCAVNPVQHQSPDYFPNVAQPPFYGRSKNVQKPLNLSSTVISRLHALVSTKTALAKTAAKLKDKYPNFASQIQTSRPERKCRECNVKWSGFQPSVEHVYSAKHVYAVNRNGNAFDQSDFALILDLCGVPMPVFLPITERKILVPEPVFDIRPPFYTPRHVNDVTMKKPVVFDEKYRTSLAKMFGDQSTFKLLAASYEEKYMKMIPVFMRCQFCETKVPNFFSFVQHILSIRHFNMAANKNMTFDESEVMAVKKMLFLAQETLAKQVPKTSGSVSTSSSCKDVPAVVKEYSSTRSQSVVQAAAQKLTTDEKTTIPVRAPVMSSSAAKVVQKETTPNKVAVPEPKLAETKPVEAKSSPFLKLPEKQIRSLKSIPLMFGTLIASEGISKDERKTHIDLIGHELTKFSAETDFERLRDVFDLRGWKTKKCVFCFNNLDQDYLCHVITKAHRENMENNGFYQLKKDYQSLLGMMVQTWSVIEEANRPPLPFVNGTRDASKKMDDHEFMQNIKIFRAKIRDYLPESLETIMEEQYRRISNCKKCKVDLTTRNRLAHFVSEEHIELMLAEDRYFSHWDLMTMRAIILKLDLEDTKIRFKRILSSQTELGADALSWATEDTNDVVAQGSSTPVLIESPKKHAAIAEIRPMPQVNVISTPSTKKVPAPSAPVIDKIEPQSGSITKDHLHDRPTTSTGDFIGIVKAAPVKPTGSCAPSTSQVPNSNISRTNEARRSDRSIDSTSTSTSTKPSKTKKEETCSIS